MTRVHIAMSAAAAALIAGSCLTLGSHRHGGQYDGGAGARIAPSTI